MNTSSLKKNQKMLAVVLAVAIAASVGGSLAYAQTASGSDPSQGQTPVQGSVNVPQMILSSVKTSFVTAANTAAGQVPNGQVLAGGLVLQQSSIVYAFKVTNGTSVFTVLVDAGNGSVLKTSQGHPLNIGVFEGMGGHGMMMHGKMGMHGGAWSKMHSGTTGQGQPSPSGTTPSGFQE